MYKDTEVKIPTELQKPKKFDGTWRIVGTDLWDQEALDLVVPAYIRFDKNGLGYFKMIAVVGAIDCRFDRDRVEFSWMGDDDGRPTCGRGWADIDAEGKLVGRIYFHQCDDTAFVAEREKEPKRP